MGSLSLLGSDGAKADVDVVLRKLPSTAPTIDVNTALNGEWQTKLLSADNDMPIAGNGGGYFFHNGNIRPITSTFTNITFNDTNIQAGTTTLAEVAVQAMPSLRGINYEADRVIWDHQTLSFAHMFGNV